MARFLTANELGRLLISQDPDNRLPVLAQAWEKDDGEMFGEGLLPPGDAELTIKHAYQTEAGDLDVLRLRLRIEQAG